MQQGDIIRRWRLDRGGRRGRRACARRRRAHRPSRQLDDDPADLVRPPRSRAERPRRARSGDSRSSRSTGSTPRASSRSTTRAAGLRRLGARRSAPGFVIDKAGHIVTSNRVISGARSVKVSFSGNDELDATRRRRRTRPPTSPSSRSTAHSRSLSPLPLGDSDHVQVGDPVVAIGNTLGLDRTATVGIVSAVQHGIDLDELRRPRTRSRPTRRSTTSNSGRPADQRARAR